VQRQLCAFKTFGGSACDAIQKKRIFIGVRLNANSYICTRGRQAEQQSKIINPLKVIRLHDKDFVPFISAQEIDFAIGRMAAQVADDFGDETPVFVGVLNGAFMVVADFMKHYKGDCEVVFIKMASYEGTSSTGEIKQLIGLNQNLEGRTVVVIEDIVDTGNTIETLKSMFKEQKVKHLRFATLFFKPEAYKKDIKLDYVGIRIPNKFIVGYGLDYDGLGRNLPEVYQLHD